MKLAGCFGLGSHTVMLLQLLMVLVVLRDVCPMPVSDISFSGTFLSMCDMFHLEKKHGHGPLIVVTASQVSAVYDECIV